MKYTVISMITKDIKISKELNRLLHDYSDIIIGRIGIPKHTENVFIITIVCKEKGNKKVDELFERINIIKEVKANRLSLEV